MLASLSETLTNARENNYAIGAFNVYNLEGVLAVVKGAEAAHSPVIIQLHPAAIKYGGVALMSLCCAAAKESRVPIGVHLDHGSSREEIQMAIARGFTSVMADGSTMPLEKNIKFSKEMASLAHGRDLAVEAELGLLSGSEDGLEVEDREARYTDPDQAATFVEETGIDALAVCIGNVHGHYSVSPRLDFLRLAQIRKAISVPIVLHGASGLPDDIVHKAIKLGVSKFNVNTELREAYLAAIRENLSSDLLDLMRTASANMKAIVESKLRLFGSVGRALT
jgi:tagatose 1,6-diphosphate aldolase GatY/KbaY